MFKRIVALAFAMAFSLICAFSGFAIEYDGIPHNDEWLESAVYSFENPYGFNNDVNFAYMRVFLKPESNQLYLCFSMRVDNISSPENSAVILSLNDGEEIYLKGTCNSPYNQNLYNIEYAMAYDVGAKNITYEIMLGVKYGIPDASNLSVRLCDCNGVPSNEFSFDIDINDDIVNEENNEEQETQETRETKHTKKVSSTKAGKTSSSKTKKTTKTKATKNKNNADSFPFNKVKTDDYDQGDVQAVDEETTSTANLTQQLVDNSSVKKKVLVSVAVVCAVAIAGGAVYSGIKKSNKKDN